MEPLVLVVDDDSEIAAFLDEAIQEVGYRVVTAVDGKALPSCDTPLWSVEKKRIVTVEGLGRGGELHPVQKALLDEQAGQCGYCISGIAVAAAALISQNPDPSEQQVREALDRNLCRCGVHNRVVRAVLRAAQEIR